MTSVTKNLYPPTKKFFFECNLLDWPIRWAIQQLSSAIGGGARALVRQLKLLVLGWNQSTNVSYPGSQSVVVHACFLMLGWFLCSLVFLCLLSVGGESSLLCCWIFFCFIIRYLDVVGSVPATLHTWVEFRIVIRLSHRRSREGQRGHASKIFRTYSHFVLWVFFPSKIVLFA